MEPSSSNKPEVSTQAPTIDYQAARALPPLSPAARTVMFGCVLFGIGHLAAAVMFSSIVIVFMGKKGFGLGTATIFLAAGAIGTAYVFNAIAMFRRRARTSPILATALCGTLLACVITGIGIIRALQPPVFAEDLIGPALLTVFPLVEAIWIRAIVKMGREERAMRAT